MSQKESGGPAFPRTGQFDNDVWRKEGGDGIVIDSQNGMSLRDWFAGMILQGMFANPNPDDRIFSMQNPEIAAYAYADAMIEARKK